MAKHEKKRKRKPAKLVHPRERVVLDKNFSVDGEVQYIIGKAREHDSWLVILGPIVMFSTVGGDAWMLDFDDGLALCLAEQGQSLPIQITQSESDFHIQWGARYVIEGSLFIAVDGTGAVREFTDYPIERILRAERRTKRAARLFADARPLMP